MRTAKALATTAGWSSLQRPLYSPGLLLEDEDLTAGVDYARDMMRLMFRSLLGCGVICGLEVGGQLVCRRRTLRVTVGGGLALDCAGNPIHVQKSVSFDFEPDCDEMPETVWVAVCYVEKCCRPRDISCTAEGNG